MSSKTREERIQDSIEISNMINKVTDPEKYGNEFKQRVREFHGLPADTEVTKARIKMYLYDLKEPRKHPSQEEDPDLAYLLSLDQKTRDFWVSSMTPNMSGNTIHSAHEEYTDYKLKVKELDKVRKIINSYKEKVGLELVLASFERFNLGTNHFEVIYAKEPFPGAHETEDLFCFANEQIPDKQHIKFLDMFLDKRNLDLVQRYEIDKEYNFGIYWTNWLEENYDIDKIKDIEKQRELKLLKTY